ncbi:unnamed protein product [Fusarium graminearum]|uniref:Ketosynthase family 3 (KS3) domain-containing protein n=1 Tax=Gibberella zeae TaxID=5518 RepID=A0A4E9E7S2_GIBZA|nr:unnamed protein product [Fusarium graminearum]
MEMQDGQDLNPTRTYVYGDYIIANRASYEFDLKGPSCYKTFNADADGYTWGEGVLAIYIKKLLDIVRYRLVGISDFSKTAIVECHRTGTAVGGPRKGDHGIYIRSFIYLYKIKVKPNIGHSKGASGLLSIIKMTLALENKTIPPNINFKTPNLKTKLKVLIKAISWLTHKLERVAINSFGIGGANTHVILESAASFGFE